MSRTVALRARTVTLLGLVALSVVVCSATAAAAPIHACVNKHSGSTRIVGSKTKCKKTERRLTWNTTGAAGPAGKPGATGATGTAGSNGVGADYAGVTFGPTTLASTPTGDLIVAKTIPAGSYLVSGNTVALAIEAKSAVTVSVACELVDTTGTPVFVESDEAVDIGNWAQSLAKQGTTSSFDGASTIQMQGQLTTTQSTTLALICAPVEGSKEATVDVFASRINALQTTANV
jgi:hypothetical protein